LRTLTLLGALAALAALDCSGSSSGATGGASNVPASGFASDYARVYCESINPCCAASGFASDAASCRSTLDPMLSAQMKLLLDNPKILYDESATGACLDAVRASLVACTDRSVGSSSRACNGVFRGTVALGGTCSTSNECVRPDGASIYCQSGLCTASTSSSNDVHGKLGDPCAWTCQGTSSSSSCSGGSASALDAGTRTSCWLSEGFYCADDGHCATAPAAGQPCGGYSLVCADNARCSSSVCVARQATDPCTFDGDCVTTAYCDSAAKLCVPPKANGQTCGSDRQCAGGDCYQSACRTWSVATAAACAGLLD
jgi:hypothetical protein